MATAARPLPCPACEAPVFKDRGFLVEAEGSLYAIHHCPAGPKPQRPLERTHECVCGLIVYVAADGSKTLHPSREKHRPHPRPPAFPTAEWVAEVERWYEVEEARAEGRSVPQRGPISARTTQHTASATNAGSSPSSEPYKAASARPLAHPPAEQVPVGGSRLRRTR